MQKLLQQSFQPEVEARRTNPYKAQSRSSLESREQETRKFKPWQSPGRGPGPGRPGPAGWCWRGGAWGGDTGTKHTVTLILKKALFQSPRHVMSDQFWFSLLRQHFFWWGGGVFFSVLGFQGFRIFWTISFSWRHSWSPELELLNTMSNLIFWNPQISAEEEFDVLTICTERFGQQLSWLGSIDGSPVS